MHWSASYVGRPYDHGVFDCTHLVVEVQANEFDRYVDLPTVERSPTLEGLSKQIEQYKESVSTETKNPKEGDVVLMKLTGCDFFHIGILLMINNKRYVLHNTRSSGTCCHSMSDLKRNKIKVLGYYKLVEKECPNE